MENAKTEKKIVKAFQAYAGGRKYAAKVANTPKAAALEFFAANPGARKCDVIEGRIEQTSGIDFFVIVYGRSSEGEWPQSFKEVTKKTADALPDVDPNEAQKV